MPRALSKGSSPLIWTRTETVDVATMASSTGKLMVFRNFGGGTFMPPLGFAVGSLSAGVVAATLNGDALPDVAVVRGSLLAGMVSVLLNRSGPPLSRDCNNNGVPDECEAAADSDGDGWLDACDDCPNTIPGIAVDDRGCPPVIPGDFDRDGDVDATDRRVSRELLVGTGHTAGDRLHQTRFRRGQRCRPVGLRRLPAVLQRRKQAG